MNTLTVDLGDRSYPIYIGSGLLGRREVLQRHISGHQVLVVTNPTVAPLYLDRLRPALEGKQVAEVILPDGEQYKNLTTLEQIFDTLLQQRFDRGCTLIALGGGVIGDTAGFAAACYQRGVHYIQIPTTLLAQVDSSVGGKTAVNHPRGKNMIGAFHQPRCVLADTDTLATLPQRELSAGLAEVVKYGLIRDADFFDWLEIHSAALLARDAQQLAHAIARSCRNKAEIVVADEREGGVRALLNLGHTFGHAIETGLGYGEWLHGEAIAAGMVLAAQLSVRLGWLESEQVDRLRRLFHSLHLPVIPPADLSPEQFLNLMAVDKKVMAGRLRLILLKGIGRAVIVDDIDPAAIVATLNQARSAE